MSTGAPLAAPTSWHPSAAALNGLAAVETRLLERVAFADDEPLVSAVCSNYVRAGGKRLRPSLLLLAAECGGGYDGGGDEEIVEAAVAVELLHTASLHHDDVIDRARTRRWRKSANAWFGNRAAVDGGNALFFLAMETFAMLGAEVCSLVSRSVEQLWTGEEREAQRAHDRRRDRRDYDEVIEAKTATLCRMPTILGARLARAAPSDVIDLGAFGHELGIAFQIVDDVLDFVGNESILGKPAMSDLRQGVYTLPIIHAMGDTDVAAELDALLLHNVGGEALSRSWTC